MKDNFNLKKFLFENKVSKNSAYANESLEELFDDEDFWKSDKAKEQEKYGKEDGEEDHVEEALEMSTDDIIVYDNGGESNMNESNNTYKSKWDKFLHESKDTIEPTENKSEIDWDSIDVDAINKGVEVEKNELLQFIDYVQSFYDPSHKDVIYPNALGNDITAGDIQKAILKVTDDRDNHNWEWDSLDRELVRDALIDMGVYKFPAQEGVNEALGMSTDDIIVYDNGGESFDRYTVFLGDDVFGFSDTGRGFNQYVGDTSQIQPGEHLGTEVDFDTLNDELKAAIMQRAQDEGDLDESVNEGEGAFVVTAKKDGEPDTSFAYADEKMAKKFKDELDKDGYTTMMSRKKVDGVAESVNEESVDESTFQSPVAAQMIGSKPYKILQKMQQFGEITPEQFEDTMAMIIDKAIVGGDFDEKIASDIIANVEKTGEAPEEKPTTSMAWDMTKSTKGRRMSDKEADKVFKEEYTPGDSYYKGIEDEWANYVQGISDKTSPEEIEKLADTAEDINHSLEASLLSTIAYYMRNHNYGRRSPMGIGILIDTLKNVMGDSRFNESVEEERTVRITTDDDDEHTEKIADKKDYKGKVSSKYGPGKKYAGKKIKSATVNGAPLKEEHIEEASNSDVLKAFYDGNSADSKVITTNGKELKTTGIGGRTIAQKQGDKFEIMVDTPSSKTEQSVIKALKKYIPSDLMENKNYKFRIKK